MFSLWVTLEIKPEGRGEFLEAITRNAARSVSNEPGCHRFDVIELGEGTNHFAFYEVYRDQAAFEQEHLTAAHFLEYREVASRVVVTGSQRDIGGPLLKSFDQAG
ncbi:putative quinol monooxygenase [Arthrobacter sp. ZGTC412]|uniref:putative quinol monooxygenase n=1 Tax=Arthrobacter sp. ZGTC412 TaxID=2058900 RepID=UPI000CE42C0D|nr:putative quinol monooxygenase [Arthrobacter sp. ZGTC412]